VHVRPYPSLSIPPPWLPPLPLPSPALSLSVCSFPPPRQGPAPEPTPRLWSAASDQGLTLVHFSAQLEPCLTQEDTLHTLNTLHTLHTP